MDQVLFLFALPAPMRRYPQSFAMGTDGEVPCDVTAGGLEMVV